MSTGPGPQLFRSLLVLSAISLGAGTVYDAWHERTARYDAANNAVSDHPGIALSGALQHWQFTVMSPAPLTPSIDLDGATATIIATAPERNFQIDQGPLALRLPPTWTVLARAKAGRYFLVRFFLDTQADPDAAHAGWRRLVGGDAELIDSVGAKAWLYDHGMRTEYQNEFHAAPPPERIQG